MSGTGPGHNFVALATARFDRIAIPVPPPRQARAQSREGLAGAVLLPTAVRAVVARICPVLH